MRGYACTTASQQGSARHLHRKGKAEVAIGRHRVRIGTVGNDGSKAHERGTDGALVLVSRGVGDVEPVRHRGLVRGQCYTDRGVAALHPGDV